VKLCMFHPNDTPMERGWVGRVDGERVIHLAAQTLQSFFLGGGGAREHAEYALSDVTLLVPVLFPPAVRVFEGSAQDRQFWFANPAAVLGPGATVRRPSTDELVVFPRLAAVVGADGAIGGFSVYADLRADGLPPQKDRDFGSVLGPVVITQDELADASLEAAVRTGEAQFSGKSLGGFDWRGAFEFAAAGTALRPGDIIAGLAPALVPISAGDVSVEISVDGIGVLEFGISG
jgi:hypothetical protein